jgi:hypothetical protein
MIIIKYQIASIPFFNLLVQEHYMTNEVSLINFFKIMGKLNNNANISKAVPSIYFTQIMQNKYILDFQFSGTNTLEFILIEKINVYY